jgi:hypothetical protein
MKPTARTGAGGRCGSGFDHRRAMDAVAKEPGKSRSVIVSRDVEIDLIHCARFPTALYFFSATLA